MAELVDASVLGTDRAICEGSSPFRPTTKIKIYKEYKLSDAKLAHQELEARKLTGPAILVP